MSKTAILPSREGIERIRELVARFNSNSGYLEKELGLELIDLTRDPRNLSGMTKVEIENLRRTVRVVRSQSGFY